MLRTAETICVASLLCVLIPLGCASDTVVAPINGLNRPGTSRSDSTNTTPVATPVTHFNLTVTAIGTGPGSDTAEVTPVRGATLTLTRVATAAGDTVTTDTDAGTATSDATGRTYFASIPTGYFYLLRSVPPAGSPYEASNFTFAPSPFSSSVTIKAWMHRAP